MEEQNSIVGGGRGSCASTPLRSHALNWFLFTVFLWLLLAQLYVSIYLKVSYETVVQKTVAGLYLATFSKIFFFFFFF